MIEMDCLGDRMKNYESRNQYFLQRRTPVCIRVDMRAGHTFTRGFARPFDEVFGNAMMETMKYCAQNIGNCVFAYCQSDEITFILVDYAKLETDAWFNYRTDKLCSIAASMATMAFNRSFRYNAEIEMVFTEDEKYKETLLNAIVKGAMFDARCFNIPKEEVTNLIYWRQLDASRNSVQMVGQVNFSHKELQNKSCNEIQDMLLTQKGINWNDYPTHLKRGSCCIKVPDNIEITEHESEWGDPVQVAQRHWEWKIDLNIPIFKGEDRNYIEQYIYV